MGSETQSQLPVIDFTDENMKPGTDTWLSACQVVRSAFEDHGFFIAVYDKIAPELSNTVFSVLDELFALPTDTKKQKTSETPLHGYYGKNPKVPLYESLAIDNPLTLEGCQKFANIMWPAGNDRFSESVNVYAKLVAELSENVNRMVFDSYGLDKKQCESFIESTNYLLRCFGYRPPKEDESDLGLVAHTDTTLLSILHQNENGLEIKTNDGEWIEANTSSLSMFLVLAGGGLMVWSNDRIRSCEHRVMIKSNKHRYSTGLLSFANKIVEIPEKLIDEEHPRIYKPFDHYGYIRFYTEQGMNCDDPVKAYCGV